MNVGNNQQRQYKAVKLEWGHN